LLLLMPPQPPPLPILPPLPPLPKPQPQTLLHLLVLVPPPRGQSRLPLSLAILYEPLLGTFSKCFRVLYKLFYTVSYNTNWMFRNRIRIFAHFICLSSPKANDWTAIRDGNNNRLSIGEFSFKKKGLLSYTEANNARDVIAMLYLMSFLHLEDYHVTMAHSTVTDTTMLRIKNSSEPTANEQPINVNSFGRVNKKLCRFIIDYVSLQVVFINLYPFSTQVAPAPYAKMTPENVMAAIKRNQMIFLSLCLLFFQVKTFDVYTIQLIRVCITVRFM
jgi:hypothetical protein